MSQSSQALSKNASEDVTLSTAFAALKTYDAGSGRATLCPIDDEVRRVLGDSTARTMVERRLLLALQAKPSVAATEYICAKLALIGSDLSVAVLVGLLPDPLVSTAARNALEKIPGRGASKALRKSLPALKSLQKIGAIQSLGSRRDAGSVGTLSGLLKQPDRETVSAAAYGLGQIGNVKAAKALREFLPRAPEALQRKVAGAALVCAERLLAEGQPAEAKLLYEVLAAPGESSQIREAASRGLKHCELSLTSASLVSRNQSL